MISQRLMAFWKYDLFPYMLCGEVTIFHDDETVETKEYGQGMRFKVFKVVPFERGLIYKKQLDELKASYYKAQKEMHIEHVRKLRDIFPTEDNQKILDDSLKSYG